MEVLDAIRNATQSILLVIGPINDAKLILRSLRQGADEYLDQGKLETELMASLVRLRAKRVSTANSGRIVGVLAATGGSGASTLAANLAVLLAKWCGPAALIDLCAAASDVAGLLDLKPEHDLADLCRKFNRLDANMLQQSLICHSSGVRLLAAPSKYDEGAQVTPQGVRAILPLARSLFPYVVLDLGRSLSAEQLAGVLQADLLLLVMRLDITSLRNARRVLEYLKELGIAEDRIRGVANRYGQPKELPLRKVEQALGITMAHRVPNDPSAMNFAANAGVPVVLERPRASVSKSLARLAVDVKDSEPLYRRNGHGTSEHSVLGRIGAALFRQSNEYTLSTSCQRAMRASLRGTGRWLPSFNATASGQLRKERYDHRSYPTHCHFQRCLAEYRRQSPTNQTRAASAGY